MKTDPSNIGKLRISQLQLLVELASSASIRNASSNLNLTQSALSKSLKEIETVLGATLYSRTKHGITVTPAGTVAARSAQLLLSEINLLIKDVRAADAGVPRDIQIGVTPYLARAFVPKVLNQLGKDGSNVLRIKESRVNNLLRQLASGELDFLLVLCDVDSKSSIHDLGLKYEQLFHDRLAIFCSRDYPAARTGSVTSINQLINERWILPSKPSLITETIHRGFVSEVLIPPQTSIEVTNLATSFELASAGLGVSAIPFGEYAELSKTKRLRQFTITPGLNLPPALLVYRREFNAGTYLSQLCNAARKVAAGVRLHHMTKTA